MKFTKHDKSWVINSQLHKKVECHLKLALFWKNQPEVCSSSSAWRSLFENILEHLGAFLHPSPKHRWQITVSDANGSTVHSNPAALHKFQTSF